MMNKIDCNNLMMQAFKNEGEYTRIYLNSSQRKVLLMMSGVKGAITPSELAALMGLSMRHCSALMKGLADKGYLNRVDASRGFGLVYEYTMNMKNWC